jgi:hypothetical protein
MTAGVVTSPTQGNRHPKRAAVMRLTLNIEEELDRDKGMPCRRK